MAVAIVGQQQPSVTQPVYVDLDVGGVHDQDIGGGGLAGHLGTGSGVRGREQMGNRALTHPTEVELLVL